MKFQLLTAEQVAERFQVSPEIVHAHVKAGNLKVVDIGIQQSEWRFHREDIRDFLDFLRNNRRAEEEPRLDTFHYDSISLPGIWRINIKPDADKGVDPRRFCLVENVAGMGWFVGLPNGTDMTWDEYCRRASNEYSDGSWSPVATLRNIPDHSVIWTRSGYGSETEFWVGIVTGPWQYRSDAAAVAADAVNVRPVVWKNVGGYECVPKAIVNAFTPVTISAVKRKEAIEFTEKLIGNYVAKGDLDNFWGL